MVDIGGATTDVHSLCDGEPTKTGVTLRGLEEPYAKRTVEGDLGMRYSALSLFEASSTREIKKHLKDKTVDIEAQCRHRSHNIRMVPQTEAEIDFDEAMAKVATDHSMTRHAGVIEAVYSPMGMVFSQTGKDLMEVKYMIGTGGVLVYSKNPQAILAEGCYKEEEINSLRPKHPKFVVDKSYILSAMGLLAEEDPDLAVRMMKKYILDVPIEGAAL